MTSQFIMCRNTYQMYPALTTNNCLLKRIQWLFIPLFFSIGFLLYNMLIHFNAAKIQHLVGENKNTKVSIDVFPARQKVQWFEAQEVWYIVQHFKSSRSAFILTRVCHQIAEQIIQMKTCTKLRIPQPYAVNDLFMAEINK